MVHVPVVVVRVCPWVGVPVREGAVVLVGAEPPPVGGPPALARMPMSRPSVPAACPVDPDVSSNPFQVVGLVPPAKVAVPFRFGEVAPDHMLWVFVVMAPGSPMFGDELAALFVNVSPLPRGSPVLWLFSNTAVPVQAWVLGSVAQPDGSAPR